MQTTGLKAICFPVQANLRLRRQTHFAPVPAHMGKAYVLCEGIWAGQSDL